MINILAINYLRFEIFGFKRLIFFCQIGSRDQLPRFFRNQALFDFLCSQIIFKKNCAPPLQH